MKVVFWGLLFSLFLSWESLAQKYPSYDSLKKSLTQVEADLYQVQLNLYQSQKQLKSGILVATLGYTVTIIGGQLLGTKPQLGETLLYVGGATGIIGAVVLFKGFKKISLGPPLPPKRF